MKKFYQDDLEPEGNCQVVECLNLYLANLNVLYIKLHNLHWNVVGVGFFDLHAKTQELYEAAATELDKVAERIKALGAQPLASMREYLQVATICELPSEPVTATSAAKIIIGDLRETLALLHKINAVAQEAHDECTSSLITDAICSAEKTIWMMTAYITRCQ